jgi:hypothetical protein
MRNLNVDGRILCLFARNDFNGVHWIQLAPDNVRWWDHVMMEINI